MAALAVAASGLTAYPSRSSAYEKAQGPATSCPEVEAIRVSREREGDVLRDSAPETAELSIVPADAGPHASVTVLAIGPVLGSMDAKDIETTYTCDANGVELTATTTRSAEYVGGVLKNVRWRPQVEVVLKPRPGGTVLTSTWKMRLTTGAEVTRTRMAPYPEVSYPVTVTKRIGRESGSNGTGGAVSMKTDRLADRNGKGGVKVACVNGITNYRPGAPRVIDTVPPTISMGATPSILWPPNGKLVTVTVSGTIQDNPGGSGVNPHNTCFFVVDQYGKIQPSGRVTLASDGSYSFTVQLQASRDDNDPNGRRYTIDVSASDNNGNTPASAVAKVIVPHDQRD